jgi:uncharacterized membrane protein YoaK (UPF0700 family)
MKIGINVWYVTLLLASIAGFCDTITFVAADRVFSAHVTGNFIVFAYDVVTDSDKRAWIKFMTLPIFIISVMTGGWIVVLAMGLQNTFGKVFSKETYGPTTMMTGNVTQAALDLGIFFRSKFKDDEARLSLRKLGANIGGFLGGCLLGAVLGKQVGLAAIALPGLALAYCHLVKARSATP